MGFGTDLTDLQNDLWVYSIDSSMWSWLGGPSTGNGLGFYGAKGTESANNLPGSRFHPLSAHESGSFDSFMLYGGYVSSSITVDDLWSLRIQREECPVGSVVFSYPFTCSICPKGLFSNQSNSSMCTSCPGGFYSLGGSSNCSICFAGNFSQQNASSCSKCPQGKFSASFGESTCTNCPVGYFQSVSGRTGCSKCSPGNFGSKSGSTVCSNCPKGTYVPVEGASSCFQCPIDAVTVTEQSVSIGSCICNEGFFGVPSADNSCIICRDSPGASCPLNCPIPFVYPGYFRSTDVSVVFRCIPSTACLKTGFDRNTTCSQGYTGQLCGECIRGSFYKQGLSCKQCPNPIQKYFGLILVLFFVLPVSYVLMFRESTYGLPPEVKLAFSAIQLLGLFPNLSNQWPAPLNGLLSGFSLVNLDIDLFAPGLIWIAFFF
jgi:hypothetical protein